MSDALSEKEASKFFNQVSRAMRSEDSNDKLTSLFDDDEEQEDTEVDTTEEEDTTDESTLEEDTPVEDDDTGDSPKDDEEDDEQDPLDEKKKAGQTAEDEEDKSDDPLKELKEQLEKLTKENHSLRSQAGRVPHIQRTLKELDEKLAKLEEKKAATSRQPSEQFKKRLDTIRETDPELADIMEAAFNESTSTVAEELITKEKENLTFLRNKEYQQYQELQAQRLLEMYPNAGEVFQSSSFKEWKSQQSELLQKSAGSDNADDVAYAFERYAADMRKLHPELAEKVEEKKTEVENVDAKKIEEARNKKKKSAANVSSSGQAGRVTIEEKDPEALFKKYSEQIRKDRTG